MCGLLPGGRTAAGDPKYWGAARRCPRRRRNQLLSAMLQGHQQRRDPEAKPVYTFEQFINGVYLPFCRRSWKESTAGTSEQIVKIASASRSSGSNCSMRSGAKNCRTSSTGRRWNLSSSSVAHLRWFLNAIFKLALSDGLVLNNPAAELRIPRKCQPGRDDAPADGRGGEHVSGGLRPPGEVDREARDLRRYAPGRDPGAPVEDRSPTK